MFKDREGINHRNEQAQKENLAALADIVRTTRACSDARKQVLVGYLPDRDAAPHIPVHLLCDYRDTDNARITEKRICRCLCYFNRKDAEQKQKCEACGFPWKKENISSYRILDYEVPMPVVIQGVGGIDLVLRDTEDEFLLAVEVKPENSSESLARMFAEILTYCDLVDYRLPAVDAQKTLRPAICFFRNSKQWEDFLRLQNDPNLQAIRKEVSVFYITYDAKTVCFHDADREPICG